MVITDTGLLFWGHSVCSQNNRSPNWRFLEICASKYYIIEAMKWHFLNRNNVL